MTTSTDTAPTRPGLVVLAAFVATLAGRFTLARIGIDVPGLNDVRVPLFAVLLMSFALEMRHAQHRSARGGRCLSSILILLGYQALSACWAPSGAAKAQGLADLAAVAVLVVLYVRLAEWNRDAVVRVTLSYFYAAAWLYFLVAAAGFGHASNGRWAALGGGPNVFVRVMAIGAVTALYLYARTGHLSWLVGVPAFVGGALASGSRGGMAALIITILVAVVTNFPRMRFRNMGRPLLTLTVLTLIAWVTAGGTISGFVKERFLDTTVEQGYTSDRDVLFLMAIDLFLQRPFLGTGINGFYAITNLGFGERYVHNLPLSVAAEGGAIGLLLLGNALYQLRREYAQVPRDERTLESRAAAYCGIFIGSASLFSGDYYDARLMWILLVLAAVKTVTTSDEPNYLR